MLIELIQVALGHREQLSRALSDKEWEEVFNAAMFQSVAGVCFSGIQRLPEGQRPPETLYWDWLGLVSQIQQQNELMDKRTAKVWRMLKDAGLDAAVLKGQGMGVMYDVRCRIDDVRSEKDDVRCKKDDVRCKKENNLGPLRQSGDIDVWVLGGYQKVSDYVQRTAPTKEVAYHRFHLNVFKDTEVELHFRPTLMRNLLDDRKLARWYNSFKAEDFVYLEDKGFAVPPPSFNRIFILTHIYRHFLFEGIGLRQVMDYYFVLKNANDNLNDNLNLNANDNENKTTTNFTNEANHQTRELLRQLRLLRFAKAMMWILHTQFGLEQEKLLCEPDEKEGRFVLNEILQTGNFGQGETRYHYKRLKTFRRMTVHGCHLLLHYPSEVLWTPVWLIYHKIWRFNKQRGIKKYQKKY